MAGSACAYFFRGANYVRYDIQADKVDVEASIRQFWPALPDDFHNDIDASVNWGNGKAYFFKGPNYVRYNIALDTVDVVAPIKQFWPALPADFQSHINAAVNWGNGNAYFFKGGHYVRYIIDKDVVDVEAPIKQFWPALPVGFQSGIRAAINWTFPIDFAALMTSAWLPVNEVGNWRARVRRGGFTPVGVMMHHTAGNNDLGVVVNGDATLAGPRANFYVARSGDLHVVSGGRANHAGAGSAQVLAEVNRSVAPPDTAARRGLTDGPSGNGMFYGFENENRGDGIQPWPEVQLDTMARAAAALCRLHCWSANRVISHAEWTSRKPDPRGINMNDFRRRVASFF